MSVKKVLAALLIIIVAVGGFITGLYLLRQRQDLGEEAAVPGGEATVSLSPNTGTFDVGDTINTGIFFNTAGIPVSGIGIKLTYPFDGTTPGVSVSSISVSPTLLSSGDWSCPVQNSRQEGSNVVVEIACSNITSSGFSTSEDTLLANITLTVQRAPELSPLQVRFDPAESVITRRSDNEDILLIPTSTGSFTIAGVESILSPTTIPSLTAAVTGTVTPTKSLTTAPTRTTTTATPTSTTLPDAGVGLPTLFGIGLSILVIGAAVLLAI